MIRKVALLVLLVSSPALAQDTPFVTNTDARPVVRADGTTFFQSVPNGGLVFEAQIAPRIIIKDSIAKANGKGVDLFGDPAGKAFWGWQLSATPMVRLRMFNETSNPVRTPSYMPKASFQVVRLNTLSKAQDADDRAEAPVAMWLLDTIPFGHHSNGQDGCLFTSQTRNANGDCVDQPGAPRTINKVNGSFSTNYIDVGLYYGRLYLKGRLKDEPGNWSYAPETEWRVGVRLQLNPKGYLPGSIDDELAPIYGQTRIGPEAMIARRNAWKCGRLEGVGQFQYIHDAPAGVPSWTTSIQGTCLPTGWNGTGLFARFYYGQDYYNLGFAEKISRLQFGVAMQQSTFLGFKATSVQ